MNKEVRIPFCQTSDLTNAHFPQMLMLPTELQLLILRCLRTHLKSLRSCSLVCRGTRYIAQEVLFERVVLRSSWSRVVRFFAERRYLVRSSRTVIYSGHLVESSADTWCLSATELVELMVLFNRLESLILYGVVLRPQALPGMRSFPSLRSLSLKHCEVEIAASSCQRNILPKLPRLASALVYNVSVRRPPLWIPTSEPYVLDDVGPFDSVTSLSHYVSENHDLGQFVRLISPASNLSSLVIDLLEPHHLASFRTALQSCASTVQYLSIGVHTDDFDTFDAYTPLRLPHMPVLLCLQVSVVIPLIPDCDEYVSDFIIPLTTSLPPSLRHASYFIPCRWPDHENFYLTDTMLSMWSEVNSILSGKPLLQYLQIVMSVDDELMLWGDIVDSVTESFSTFTSVYLHNWLDGPAPPCLQCSRNVSEC